MKPFFSCLAQAICCIVFAAPMVNRYGQSATEEWPGKIACDEQMQIEFQQENATLANVKPNLKRFDRFEFGINPNRVFVVAKRQRPA